MNSSAFFFFFLAVVPVRADKQDQSEIITQLLFGEVATLIDRHNQWIKIKSSHDNYEGWIDEKQVLEISEEEHGFWLKNTFRQTMLLKTWDTPFGEIQSMRGSNTPNRSQFKVAGFTFQGVQDFGNLTVSSISDVALSYLNSPYLWGGRTPFGIDCSGFTQAVYRFFNIELPRDAYQQANFGENISFKDRKKGDIVFFQNKQKKIHHVGILLANDEIIHASGRVRIDKLTQDGIIKKEELTHHFHSLKRLC